MVYSAAMSVFERTFHPDEANQAFAAGRLAETGVYEYDPHDHHGPTLYYAAAAIQKAAGHGTTASLDPVLLRCTPLLFAVLGLLAGYFAVRRLAKSGFSGIVFTLLLATSPVFFFFATDFIQEMLLASFTLMMLLCAAGYVEPGRGGRQGVWALLGGIAAGLACATKETASISFAAAAVACIAVAPSSFRSVKPRHATLALSGFLLTVVLFYSSFCTNWRGVGDFLLAAPLSCFSRACGDSASAGWHVHPWRQHIVWLFGGQPALAVFAAAGILAGIAAIVRRRSLNGRAERVFAATAVYAAVTVAIYSAIPYKTPWCALQMHVPVLISAVLGMAAFCAGNAFWPRCASVAAASALLCSNIMHTASIARAPDSKGIPYNYASASPEVVELASLVAENVREDGDFAAIALPPEDLWPLPFYLRACGGKVGYWKGVEGLESVLSAGAKPSAVVVPVAEGLAAQNMFPWLGNTKRFEIRSGVRARIFYRGDADGANDGVLREKNQPITRSSE